MVIFEKNRLLIMLTTVLVVLLCFWSGFVAAANLSTADFPFQPGEKLVYKLRWGLVSAGYAELEVLPSEKLNGENTWHFLMSVRTSGFVDLFYKVRDRIQSFTDLALANSMLYLKEQREGNTDRDIEVRFDLHSKSAVYSNKGEARDAIEIKDGTIDPLAALYYIRKQPLAENVALTKFVTDGKKTVMGVAKVVGREKLTVAGIEYDTFLVEPDLKDVRGVFEKSKKSKIRLWITNDDRRLLVKLKSKVAVGSFTGILVEATVPL